MAVSLVVMGTPTYSAANVANGALAPTITAAVAGELLLFFAYTESTTATATTPTGYTSLTTFPLRHSTTLGGSLYVFAKVAAGGETSASSTWAGLTTGTSGTPAGCVIGKFVGADTSDLATIQDGTAVRQANASAGNIGCPSITTTLEDSAVFNFGIKPTTSTTFSHSTFTEILDTNTASGLDMGAAAYMATQIVPGASGANTILSATVTANISMGVTFALKAAGSVAMIM